LQAEEALRHLERQRLAEQTLQQEKRTWERQLSDRQTQTATLALQLDRLKVHQSEIGRLAPLIQQQVQLEQEQQTIGQQLQDCLAIRQSIKTQGKHLAKLQIRQAQLDAEITRLKALESSVQEIPVLEQQQQRYQQQLSRIAAAVQFETDLRQLLTQSEATSDRYLEQVYQAEAILHELQTAVPLWAEALYVVLTTLQQGRDRQDHVLNAIQAILADLSAQTSVTQLEQQLYQIQTQLKIARQQQAEVANLERRLAEQQQLAQEASDLQTDLATLQTQLAVEPSVQERQTAIANALAVLEDPWGRSRFLQEELQQQPQLQAQFQDTQAEVVRIQTAIAQLDQQLVAFTTLLENIQEQQQLRDQHRQAYEEYLSYRELANTRRDRQQQLQDARQQVQVLTQEMQAITEECDLLQQTFDSDRFQSVQVAYQTAKEQQIAHQASLPGLVKYLTDLEQQVAKLQALQAKRVQAETALEQTRLLQRFVKFARDAYKKAGPRITERYLQQISQEADKLFRELMNRLNVGLEWTRDYDIVVREGMYSRRFVNLSGGEQMCAALAVRLALLKVLADVDIAFFDEPTTNMDRPRREHLAEAIANIKTFRQLFVISHDDTFEKITETIILVEREPA
jgi:exonuclease SbcC